MAESISSRPPGLREDFSRIKRHRNLDVQVCTVLLSYRGTALTLAISEKSMIWLETYSVFLRGCYVCPVARILWR